MTRRQENRACALTRAIMTSYDSKAEIKLQSWQLGLRLAKPPRRGPCACLSSCPKYEASDMMEKIETLLLASEMPVPNFAEIYCNHGL